MAALKAGGGYITSNADVAMDFTKATGWTIKQLNVGWDVAKTAKGVQVGIDGTLAAAGGVNTFDPDNPVTNNPIVQFAALGRGVHGATGGNWSYSLPEAGHDVARLGREGAHNAANLIGESGTLRDTPANSSTTPGAWSPAGAATSTIRFKRQPTTQDAALTNSNMTRIVDFAS